ncbi:MAG TPA: DNA primase small subunit domain-containing protein [Candidatus Nanoarchaeia archaeon]|nr:DNA primase small subunit domain-containing protein [Candidatus Nanoarchaeia archaeon]
MMISLGGSMDGKPTLGISALLMHYKRKEVQAALVKHAQDKEVAIRYGEGGYGKRPDTLQYNNDILSLAQKGATSFHSSEERWSNPSRLDPLMKRQELDDLRIGWDLMLDIDCPFLEYSGIAADLLIKALRHSGIRSISCKFSGNHGFHIGVPFEAFPERVNGIETKKLFPDAPRKIASYLQEKIKVHLAAAILQKDDISKIMKMTGKQFGELVRNGEFDPFKVLTVDTVLISSRHLYRMPYSFNEKSGLVSIPIDPDSVLSFNKESAKPEKVLVDREFLSRESILHEEAKQLIVQAFDHAMKKELLQKEAEVRAEFSSNKNPERKFEELQEAVPEELFPPCIKLGLRGMDDGKKRFLFILVNFLNSAGWSQEQIEKRLKEWNEKNKEPLRETILVGQVRYHCKNKKILPPNCKNQMYYLDMQLCKPDNFCAKINNPANYARRKAFALQWEKRRLFLKEEKKGKRAAKQKKT